MNARKEPHLATIKDAAQKLTGAKSRAFQARGALSYFHGSARRADAVFGWSRRTVILGLPALRTGITWVDNTSARGNRKTKSNGRSWPNMRSLAAPPPSRSTFTSVVLHTDDGEGPATGVDRQAKLATRPIAL
jgi:hypothetical protein